MIQTKIEKNTAHVPLSQNYPFNVNDDGYLGWIGSFNLQKQSTTFTFYEIQFPLSIFSPLHCLSYSCMHYDLWCMIYTEFIINISILTRRHEVHTLYKSRKYIHFQNHMAMGKRSPIAYKACTPFSICRCETTHPNTPIKFACGSNQLG